jgi:hypothetical protein
MVGVEEDQVEQAADLMQEELVAVDISNPNKIKINSNNTKEEEEEEWEVPNKHLMEEVIIREVEGEDAEAEGEEEERQVRSLLTGNCCLLFLFSEL